MLDRDDLVFATCYQLVGMIKDDWEDGRPEDVDSALACLSKVDEPESISEHKPGKIVALQLCADSFKTVLAHSDGWKTTNADMLKKEMISRIKEYEQRIKVLSGPVLDAGSIELHA